MRRRMQATKNRAGCSKRPHSTIAGHLFESAPRRKTVVTDVR
jgi:hypothetical protein